MKSLLNKITILINAILLLNINALQAQFAPPLNFSDNTYSAGTAQGRNTGCDILQFAGDTYRVGVWEPLGTTRAIGWEVNYGGTTYTSNTNLAVSGNIIDPDVCLLVKSPGTIAAAVTYYNVTNSCYYLEIFQWNTTTLSFNSVYLNNFFTAPFGTTINIDGNTTMIGEFTIVWDDPGGRIYSAPGDLSTGLITVNLHTSGVAGFSPDVSMYEDGTNDIVHIAYVDLNTGNLMVADYTYAALAAGSTSSPSMVLNASPYFQNWTYPRIASPGPVGGSVNEWTVVAEDYNTFLGSWYIVGYNNGSGPIVYNDGIGTSPAILFSTANFYISVCYSDFYPNNGIYVGWTFSNLPPSSYGYPGVLTNTEYPIVLACDKAANPLLGSTYWQVPTLITNNSGDLSGFLSLASRHAKDEMFLTYQNIIINGSLIWDVDYKMAPGISGVSSLKIADNNIQKNVNGERHLTDIECYSIEGKLLFKHDKFEDLNTKIKTYLKNRNDQIIIVKTNYNDGSFVSNKYLVNQ